MPDQELTALRIKIEADVKAALDKLDALSAKMVAVSSQVVSSVTRINTALKTIDGKVIDLKVNVQGNREINSLKKQLESVRAAAGNAVNAPASSLPQVRQKQQAVVPSESEISSFVSAVKAGVAVSVEELKKFRSALTALFEAKQLRLGVDDTEVQQLKKDLEFLNGFINASKRDIKVRVSTEGDAEIRQKLNNLQKDYVLRIIPSFNDADFNKLLTEIQNKRINLTFEDVSDAIKEEIRKVEAISANLPIGADTSNYDAKVNQLRSTLTKIQAVQVTANTQPAETSIAQLENKVKSVLSKGPTLTIDTKIVTRDTELTRLNTLKKQLEAKRIAIPATMDNSEVIDAINQIDARIKYLNEQTVNVTVNAQNRDQSLAQAQQAVKLAKEFKAELSTPVTLRVNSSGLKEVERQSVQVGRSIEQIIRDTPSFTYGFQQGLIAISNNIGPLQDSLKNLSASAKANQQSIGQALKASLTGWNGVTIAISAAVSLVTLFAGKIFTANKDAERLKDKFKEIKELIENTRFVVPEAVGSKLGERTEVRAQAAILDSNKSLDERAKALNRLQQLDKELFGGFTLQQKSYENLGEAVDKYIEKLEALAAQEGRIQNVNKLGAERNKLQEELDDINAQLEIENRRFQRNNTFVDPNTGKQITVVENASKAYLDLTKRADAAQKQINKLNDTIAIEQGKIIAFGVTAPDASSGSNAGSPEDDTLKRILQSRKELLESELKNISEISERYFVIQQEIAGLDLQIKNIGEVNREIKTNNFEAYQNSLKGINIAAKAAGVELTNLKLTLDDPTFFAAPNIDPFVKLRQSAIDAKLEIDKLFRSGSLTEDEKLKAETELEFKLEQDVLKAQKELDSYQLLIKTGIAPQLEPVIPDQTFEDLPELPDFEQWAKDSGYAVEDWGQKLRNSLKPLEEGQRAAEQLANELENLIAGVIADGLGDLAESFLEGTLTLQKFGDQLAKIAKDLTVALIKFAAFTAIKAALPGIGNILGLASGGIATGPTLAMIGEGRESEAVLPLSYLRNLIGGDAAPVGKLTAEVGMDSIIFGLERNMRRQGRSFGG